MVKQRLQMLGYTATDNDISMINWEIGKAERYIMNFCNITEVPNELFEVLVDMVCAVILMTKKVTGALVDYDFSAAVKAIQEGDAKVEYAVGDGSQTPEQRFDILMNKLANPPVSILIRYRRLQW